MRSKICCWIFASLLTVGSFADKTDASFITSQISFANVVGSPMPYGTVTISDGVGSGLLRVSIDVNNGFGTNRDINQFGFNVNTAFKNLNVTLTALPVNPANYPSSGPYVVTQNDKVKGNGNNNFNYMVNFGSGAPYVEPIMFDLFGAGLDISDFTPAGTTGINNSTGTINFGIHLQSTQPLAASVFLGGNYGSVQTEGPTSAPAPEVPEPTSVLIWLSASICGVGLSAYRKRTKLVC